MSFPGPLPQFILPLDPNLFPQVVDRVERARTTGSDLSGIVADEWDVVYTDLPCLADLHERGERGIQRAGRGATAGLFGQATEEVDGAFYFQGELDIRKRDRMAFGTWPGGQTRYIDVRGAFDATAGLGLVYEVVGATRKPG